jgi:hypothetical protein
MEAKEDKPAPVALAICPSCAEHPGCKGTVAPAEDGSCKGFSAKESVAPVNCKDCEAIGCAHIGFDITRGLGCTDFKTKEVAL